MDRFQYHPARPALLLAALLVLFTLPFGVSSERATAQTSATDGAVFQSAADAPVINVWYGPRQRFGHIGDTQVWANILGNVSGPNPVRTLRYTLNGGPAETLRIGPDGQRLAQAGDFNIELDYLQLQQGDNLVVITALDDQGAQTNAEVVVEYRGGKHNWPEQTYVINWNQAAKLQDVAQIIDGNWAIQGNTVRPQDHKYDRLLSFGDMTWSDYVVTVPVTIFAIDEAGYEGSSNGPGVGIVGRWMGHFDNGRRPRSGWQRLGGLAWYKWYDNPQRTTGLQLIGGGGSTIGAKARSLAFGVTYVFKLSIESADTGTAVYRFKVWESGQPEPAEWDIIANGNPAELRSGSIELIAHHVDAAFGPVTIQLTDTVPLPGITRRVSGVADGSIQATPQKSRYRFGETVSLSAAPGTGAIFAGWRHDLSGNANPATLSMFGNRKVTAVFANSTTETPTSDDFSGCEPIPNPDIWTYIDPLGDVFQTWTGSQIIMAIPAGVAHQIGPNNLAAPRLIQYVQNRDFGLEAGFESVLTTRHQMHGIVVEESHNNLLRFSFVHDGIGTRAVVIALFNNSATTIFDTPLSGPTPPFMRVRRAGNNWTLSYSTDGAAWTNVGTFTYQMAVTAAGPFAGTLATAPAYTAVLDYFFNTASPIIPEDGNERRVLDVNIVGGGQVSVTPDKSEYACGEVVALQATANAGWTFAGWSGDETGAVNPIQITMDRSKSITATFTQQVYDLQVTVVGNGTVDRNPDKPNYLAGEVVTLTAAPARGWRFGGWSGDASGGANPIQVTMNRSKQVTATFLLTESRLYLPYVGSPN